LIALRSRGVGRQRPARAKGRRRRQRHLAVSLQERGDVTSSIESAPRAGPSGSTSTIRPAPAPPADEGVRRAKLAPGPHQRQPLARRGANRKRNVAGGTQQQISASPPPSRVRAHRARITRVSCTDQQVTGSPTAWENREGAVHRRAGPSHDQQPCRFAKLAGVLRDQARRQLVVVRRDAPRRGAIHLDGSAGPPVDVSISRNCCNRARSLRTRSRNCTPTANVFAFERAPPSRTYAAGTRRTARA